MEMGVIMNHVAEAFHDFARAHEYANRFFWSTDASYHLASHAIDHLSGTTIARNVVPLNERRRYTFSHYKARFEPGHPRTFATVADLKHDLAHNHRHLVKTTILEAVSNLEHYLNKWIRIAVSAELRSRKLADGRKRSLVGLMDTFEQNYRKSMSLPELDRYFPALGNILRSTTHKRTYTPLLSVPIAGVTCLDAAQMWREIRNLILHHGGRCHADFVKKWGAVWESIIDDEARRGKKVGARKLLVDATLPIGKRHVTFCLETCYQTAVVLFIAGGGAPAALVVEPGKVDEASADLPATPTGDSRSYSTHASDDEDDDDDDDFMSREYFERTAAPNQSDF